MGFQCIHIKSLFYCPISSEKDVILNEEVLSDMVRRKWISDNTKNMCVARKQISEAEKSPLSKEIILGSENSKIHISVLEPHTAYYSRLGRVMVCYDKKSNTWHCPCSKARRSCPHKSVAKWHLNQTQPELFLKVRSTDSDVFDTFSKEHDSQYGRNTEEKCIYPPKGKELASLVLYLINKKRIPAVLSKNVSSHQSNGNFPKYLIPQETFCSVCPGRVPLSEPVIITQKAKIVTFTGIVEGM